MDVKIIIQHMACQKIVNISLCANVEELKKVIEETFSIPASDQIITFKDRNINLKHKTLNSFGIENGCKIFVKKINRITGQARQSGISDLMKNPLMKSMLKNPSMLKDIIGDNDTINQIVNSGGLEEELERMAQDGDYVNTQLRNVDLAMAKLENMPGGMNMMSSMLKDVDDPLRNMLKPKNSFKTREFVTSDIVTSLPGKNKVNPLIDYRKQNRELVELGFTNIQENFEALTRSEGDLDNALEYLTSKYDMNDK